MGGLFFWGDLDGGRCVLGGGRVCSLRIVGGFPLGCLGRSWSLGGGSVRLSPYVRGRGRVSEGGGYTLCELLGDFPLLCHARAGTLRFQLCTAVAVYEGDSRQFSVSKLPVNCLASPSCMALSCAQILPILGGGCGLGPCLCSSC